MRRSLILIAFGVALVGCQAAASGATSLGYEYGAAAAAPTAAAAPAAPAPAKPADVQPSPKRAGPAAGQGQAALTTPATAPQTFRILPEQSEVRYEVGEVFFREGNRFNIAIGITKVIGGEVRVDRAQPRNSTIGPIAIDISAFKSDRARRDQFIRDRWLESARFPMATFTPTRIEGLPERYVEGAELALRVTGDLTIREATKPTTFAVAAKLQGDTLTATGTTTIRMSDFGFDPPEILGTLKAENEAKLVFTFVALRAG
ncbi:MAG: YceI family protein [Chloroflexi bacterium]|nr:YceI family protein [Chloroflexota bacterium]